MKSKAESPKTEKAGKADERLLPDTNIGIVGHVDHGKTTLTYSLTNKWTDTHSEEIKRGITIRLGYSDMTIWECASCSGTERLSTTDKCASCGKPAKPLRTYSIVDAPGHETLMTTVLSGAAIMDGALLLISAAEPCPQPQTREHLKALDIVGIRNIIIVQNKIDLVSEQEAMESYRQIREFVKGTVAENAPIIPVSAQQRINLDLLLQAILDKIHAPPRDKNKSARMLIARSFDANRPGTPVQKLMGGVIGGSIVSGSLAVGQSIEIKPGVKIRNRYASLQTEIASLFKGGRQVESASAGGLVGVGTKLDPGLTKSDTLAGNTASEPGKLGEARSEISITANLLEYVIGAREKIKVDNIKPKETLLLTIGIYRTVGNVTALGKKLAISLKIPVCAYPGDRVAISRQMQGRWRLVGWGEVAG